MNDYDRDEMCKKKKKKTKWNLLFITNRKICKKNIVHLHKYERKALEHFSRLSLINT